MAYDPAELPGLEARLDAELRRAEPEEILSRAIEPCPGRLARSVRKVGGRHGEWVGESVPAFTAAPESSKPVGQTATGRGQR
ncbi:MAG: hypothetical protein ACKOEY_01705, partial [Phenylobacterium sp.]